MYGAGGRQRRDDTRVETFASKFEHYQESNVSNVEALMVFTGSKLETFVVRSMLTARIWVLRAGRLATLLRISSAGHRHSVHCSVQEIEDGDRSAKPHYRPTRKLGRPDRGPVLQIPPVYVTAAGRRHGRRRQVRRGSQAIQSA
jgi:hypothetical protein